MSFINGHHRTDVRRMPLDSLENAGPKRDGTDETEANVLPKFVPTSEERLLLVEAMCDAGRPKFGTILNVKLCKNNLQDKIILIYV